MKTDLLPQRREQPLTDSADLRNSSFLIQKSSFLIHNSSFLTQNSRTVPTGARDCRWLDRLALECKVHHFKCKIHLLNTKLIILNTAIFISLVPRLGPPHLWLRLRLRLRLRALRLSFRRVTDNLNCDSFRVENEGFRSLALGIV